MIFDSKPAMNSPSLGQFEDRASSSSISRESVDLTLVGKGNEAFLIRVWKHIPNICVFKS